MFYAQWRPVRWVLVQYETDSGACSCRGEIQPDSAAAHARRWGSFRFVLVPHLQRGIIFALHGRADVRAASWADHVLPPYRLQQGTRVGSVDGYLRFLDARGAI
jgi:hypothetical protein